MGGWAKRSRAAALIFAAGLLLVGSLVASASGGVPINLIPEPTQVRFKARTEPTKLSPTAPTPVELRLEGKLSTTDVSRVPALETLSLHFDRAGSIFTKGLPTCSLAELEGEIEWVKSPCQDALVGHGVVTGRVYFPEQVLLLLKGPLKIYNGRPKDGHPVLIYTVYAHVPAATTFFTSGEILNERGRFGTQTSIHIPKIDNGTGSILSFKAQIGRSWTYKGHEVSLLTASCPKGRLAAKAEFDFVGGENDKGEVEADCS